MPTAGVAGPLLVLGVDRPGFRNARRRERERQRHEADQRAREAERQIEVDREKAKGDLEERTAKKRTANSAAASTRAKAVRKEATKADADRLRKEGEARRAKKQAVAAQSKVLDLDKAVRAKKTTRRAN